MTNEEILRRYPVLTRLAILRDAGWRFRPCTNDSGELTGIGGYYAYTQTPGVADALFIASDTDATAGRVRHDVTVWQFEGTLADAIDGLLCLPAPDDRTAPRLAIAAIAPLWTPTAIGAPAARRR